MKKGTIVSIATLVGASAGAAALEVVQSKKKKKDSEYMEKMGEFYRVLLQWLSVRQEDKSLVSYFIQNNYKTVAIYGMKELGERLYDELKDSEVEVKYIIDRNAESIYADVDVITPENIAEEVDVIVVTAIHYFEEIEAMLEPKVACPIISLEDLVYEV